VEALLKDDPNVAFYASYIGAGTPRFYLPTNPELRQSNFGQFVIMTKGLHEREIVFEKLEKAFAEEFPEGLLRVARLENGPPVGFPVQFRVIGSDPAQIREIAYQVRDTMRANPHTANVNLEWNELSKTVRLEVDHKKARALGVNPQDLSTTLYTLLSGLNVTQFREGTELISVVARAIPAERLSLTDLEGINVSTSNGGAISLAQIATVKYELEEPVLWRRNLETMINVRADIWDGVQAPVVTAQINPQLDLIRATLPDGYRIDVGGAVEESAKGQNSINAMMPLMIMIMVTTLMIQLQSFQRLIIVLLTAPLGLIGVAAALLITGMPFGFVATLGTIALAGMIMRNSVILVDQIEQDVRAGHALWDAIIDATVRRARPIALTAAAAILAMVPLSFSAFWGPMAVSIMGGLTVATLLTLLFLPALYAAWFRAKPVQAEEEDPSQDIRRRALAQVPALAAPGVPSNRPAE
jgi:multidrug efflux pump